ncbi:AEC family transporter [Curvivirga aplysinae]|uniref:AEC family transporter n=1 Tax=Curvivirga aplysinae TaxID=2529852 RepID=UPI0012BD47E3|nr:AEC family transporter [Curvivirga aplysinae]MTI11302.1 AEC family transporter [Curvivirga aplysinae]
MTVVLEIVLPVFGIVMMGFGANKLGWFSEQAEQGLTTFTFNFAAPLMLFNVISQVDLPSDPPISLFITFYGPLFTVAILGFLSSRYIFKRNYTVQVISGFSCAFGNLLLLGLPLFLLAFGEEKILPFFILLSVHGLTLFTIVTILLEIGVKKENSDNSGNRLAKTIVVALIQNPILIGIICGLTVNLLQIPMPEAVYTLSGLMKGAMIPAALFALGSSLTRYGIRGRFWESLSIVICKIIIFPILVYVVGTYIFELDYFVVALLTLMAAQPPGVMGYMFATKYHVGEAVVSTSIYVAAVSSVVTLTWLLYFFNVR